MRRRCTKDPIKQRALDRLVAAELAVEDGWAKEAALQRELHECYRAAKRVNGIELYDFFERAYTQRGGNSASYIGRLPLPAGLATHARYSPLGCLA